MAIHEERSRTESMFSPWKVVIKLSYGASRGEKSRRVEGRGAPLFKNPTLSGENSPDHLPLHGKLFIDSKLLWIACLGGLPRGSSRGGVTRTSRCEEARAFPTGAFHSPLARRLAPMNGLGGL